MKNQALAAIVVFIGLGATPVVGRAADDADIQTGLASFRTGAFAEAYHAWSAASAAGDGRGARFIGVMWDAGQGVPQDAGNALRAYRRAADLGDPVGMFNVGVSYDSGGKVPRDEAAAAYWYGRGAALHHGRSEYNLALMYQAGEGVRRDPVVANRLFEAAARDGIAAARAHLPLPRKVVARQRQDPGDGLFMQAQRALISRDPQALAVAAGLFRQVGAGRGTDADMAQYDLGWCYENGVGVPVDRQQAYALYLHVAAETADPSLRDLAEAGAMALHGRTLLAGTQAAVVSAQSP